MTRHSARLSDYNHVHRLTPAELALLVEYSKEPVLANIARKLGVSNSCIQLRAKSIREKLEVNSMQEALEKMAPRAGLEPAT